MRELHVGLCGLSDQITLPGEETTYDVVHVVNDKKTFVVHTLCGKMITLLLRDSTVVYVGHNMKLWNKGVKCPTCGKKCEA